MSSWRFKDKLLLVDALGTTLTGQHAVYASEVEFAIESETEADELETAHSGASLDVIFGKHVTLNFKTPLSMCGTPGQAPAIAPLLLSCGFVQVADASSVTYALGDASKAKALVRFGQNTHEISEMLGNVSLNLEKGIPKLNWQFKGLFSPPVQSTAAPAVDWNRWQRPEVLGVECASAFTLNEVSRVLHKLTVDVGNNVIYDRAINHEAIMLTGHESKAQMTVRADSLGNFNPFNDIGKVQHFEFSHGTTAGKKFTLIGRYQLPTPKYTNLDSELTGYELDGKLVPSGAGYDELTLVFE